LAGNAAPDFMCVLATAVSAGASLFFDFYPRNALRVRCLTVEYSPGLPILFVWCSGII